LVADDAAIMADDDQNFSELMERQIDDVAAFRNTFWVDYRNDWLVSSNPDDPVYHLLSHPEKLSDLYFNVGSTKNRFQAFPAREIVKTVNEYGEVVHASEFESSETTSKNFKSAASIESESKKLSNNKSSNEIVPISSVPFKWESKNLNISVKCSRKFISGFTGLSDGRSLKTIISRINPRKLIVVGGSIDATGFLLNHYKMSAEGIEAHAPKINESVNVSSSLNLLSATISEALLNQMRVSFSQDFEVAHMLAKVKIKEDVETGPSENQNMPSENNLTYELVPTSLDFIPTGPSILIGDIKLSEFRKYLAIKYSSIKAEFTASGDLICNDKVLVKRDHSSGQMLIEGPLCKEYYQIRNSFYENITMV
jgi:cleavage and polyadenylation specificity factor subunit 2